MTGTGTDPGRWNVLDGVVGVSGALAVGSALLAIGHLGVQLPVISRFGPAGARAVVPAAIAFGVAACLHGTVAVGVTRRRSWAWPLGVLVAGITLIGAATPFRGAASAVGIVLATTQLDLLLTRPARRTILNSAGS
ncbi:MAG: hypothetical protein KY460_13810 [Actinobacteria bacterium]|nr:hypothetical protein [Actinomycetota bacterium]